ncbi:MAG: glycosyltransferase family 87 protein [Candidatus Sumerlaeia bacterium]|nr:glycosyltransferase family 87 protein [Candidatus Sumerlaeia bacterium]
MGVLPAERFWRLAWLLAVVWAFALAVVFRQTSADSSFPKVDAIAFYTAGSLAAEGRWNAMYTARAERRNVAMDVAPVGAMPGAPLEFSLITVRTSSEWRESALAQGYPDSNAPPFAYTPGYAVLFQGLALLPWRWATFMWDALNLLIFAGGLALFCRDASERHGSLILAVALLLLPLAHPLQFSLFCGQGTPMIVGAGLILFSTAAGRLGAVPAGVLGAVCGVVLFSKLLPILWVVPLFAVRRWALVSGVLAGVAIVLVLGLVVAPWGAHLQMVDTARALLSGVQYWSGNQSLEAFVGRFWYSTNLTQMPGTAVEPFILGGILKGAKLLLLLGLLIFTLRSKAGLPRLGVLWLMLPALLPHLSWSHYGLYAVPALILCGASVLESSSQGWRRGLQWGVLILLGIAWGMNPDFWKILVEGGTGGAGVQTLFRIAVGLPFLAMLGVWTWAFGSTILRNE